MIKDIKYNGYTTAPSDYESPDGALAASLNVIAEDKHLVPLMPPTVKVALPADCNVIFVHKTNEFTHYIVCNTATHFLYWMDATAAEFVQDDAHKIGGYVAGNLNAIGNTLMIFVTEAIQYFLWRDATYKYLGDHLPHLELSFGLKGKARFFSLSDDSKSTFRIEFDPISTDDIYNTWTESNKSRITSQVMAKVNKFLREQSVNKGRFSLPFLVRYALRLYDGTLTCHSAPVLMSPSTRSGPIVLWNHASGEENEITEAYCDIMLMSCSIDYALVHDEDGDYRKLIDNWTDIVKSVDVFISAPIYPYDQNGECSSFGDTDNFDTKFIGALDMKVNRTAPEKPLEDHVMRPIRLNGVEYEVPELIPDEVPQFFKDNYLEWNYSTMYSACMNYHRTYPNQTINMPEYSEDKIHENIRNVSNFYLLASIPVSELSLAESERKDIEVGEEYLQSLVTREVMTDDYLSHDRLFASYSHDYNARLNLAGVRRHLFRGFSAASLFAYKNRTRLNVTVEECSTTFWDYVNWHVYSVDYNDYTYPEVHVYLKENGETYQVKATHYLALSSIFSPRVQQDEGEDVYLPTSWGCYLFYPNPNAFKMVVREGEKRYAIDLKPHDFLNGAYAMLDFELIRKNNVSAADLPVVTKTTNIVNVANKVYTSEAGNPFFFPVTGINTVGTGTILGISSATKALSQGQFGQFPLYAFTTEGVWALEVSATGTYSAKQPVTRDVCINSDSITQLDSTVLFATDRGIMMIAGSNTSCITETIDSQHPFDLLNLPQMDKLHTLVGHSADTCLPTVPFLTFLAGCAMVYDYVHQHVIVYNPAYTYAYVYSMRSHEWGMTYSNIASAINAYPDALAMTHDSKLVSFSDNNDVEVKCLYVTRPIKLEIPDVLKTIDTVIQRGLFRRGNVQTVLYGSRDLYNWFLVWSSKDHFLRGFRGTPYKYFRIAGVAKLTPDKSIFGASIQYTPKFLNQPR